MPAPLRKIDLGRLETAITRGPDGVLHVRSPLPLDIPDTHVTAWLDTWAERAPQRLFLAERDGRGTWHGLTYAAARVRVRALAAALLGRNLGAGRPFAVLSGNSIAHALAALAALYVGIPYAPISPAYVGAASGFDALRRIVEILTPGLVFVENGRHFADAAADVLPKSIEIVAAEAPAGRATDLAALFETLETPALDAAHAQVGPDTIAKFLFTSGSTAIPKAVITTQRMLCANQEMIAYSLRFLRDAPPTLVDWLPWHHSFGGNQNFNLVLRHGGTLYIDAGRPGEIAATLSNLREIAPTLYFNVPGGFEALLPHLENDNTLAKNFFRRLQLAFCAGAPLAARCAERFTEIAAKTCGERIEMMCGYGATETSPAAAFAAGDDAFLPLPGSEFKLVPRGGRYEARISGPHVTPGYWRHDDPANRTFDAEGYYRLGDALCISKSGGLRFDGRLGEDFKLATGVWANVGSLRNEFIEAFAPYVQDLAIAGEGEADLAALVFANVAACRALAPFGTHASPAEILAHPEVVEKFRVLLNAFAASGSAHRIARIALLHEPPEPSELTEKGTLNQRKVLANRAALVRDLYGGRGGAIIVLEQALAGS